MTSGNQEEQPEKASQHEESLEKNSAGPRVDDASRVTERNRLGTSRATVFTPINCVMRDYPGNDQKPTYKKTLSVEICYRLNQFAAA